ncbi:alpha/beta fold hydrolase [Actinacidiphila acidipaludis]|uniref:Alpha/beta hydrolase n=1 Tax=Actinacidiphila acidipaludis TaxID=2873382 RepID=A0ABS7QH43_9ACTN|nr:alpha/beta fold hydrolase [Streptomyces acidipaludis]MBY8882491.1 alpha/beta hydrolase [Streptomyces acidipaludis]
MGYEDTGEGRPASGGTLVLVHGHPFDRTMWAPQLRTFGERLRVVVPDLRGYGETTVVPGTTPLETFARDIAALLDHLGVRRATLCGLSMGGQIVMEFHRLFPGRVAGLVLADTFAQGETPEGHAERNARADTLLREGMAGYAHSVLDSMITPANVRELPEVAGHVLRMMLRTSPEGAAAALRGRAERPDYTPTLPRIAVPALVVVGRDDAFTPVADARYLHERIPGAGLAVIEGAGHLPNLERPAEFDRALAGLLATVAARETAEDVTNS